MKKQTSFLLLFIFLVSIIKSQSWTIGGNTISGPPPNLGTINNQPLNFFTNGIKKGSFSSPSGVFNVVNLAGTGSRFLQANSSGDLIEWTGTGDDANKALFGDNTFKTLPFTFDATKMSINPGVKLGVGTTDPAAELDVVGDAKISGKIMLFSSYGLSYSSTDNVFIMGKQTGVGIPSPNSCNNALPSGYTWTQNDGFRCVQIAPTGATNINASLGMYLSPVSGNGYLDANGIDANGNNNALYINSNCGRNTNINTGTAGAVQMGNLVRMAKHLQIGDSISGIVSAPNNTALDIHVNSGKGLKIKTTSNSYSNDMFTVEVPDWFSSIQTPVFNIGSDGKTVIGSYDASALVIKDITGTNAETLRLHGAGAVEIMPSSSGAISIQDPSNSYKETFSIDKNGLTKINTTNSKAFSISNIGSSSTNETFSVDKNGYTEIKVYSPSGMPAPYSSSARAMTIRDMTNNKDIFVVNSNGKVYAREVEISLTTNFPDYVFKKDYNLKSIQEVESYILKHGHLPGFEKGDYYEKNGINVNEILIIQQEKIEELTLYIIELEKRFKNFEEITNSKTSEK